MNARQAKKQDNKGTVKTVAETNTEAVKTEAPKAAVKTEAVKAEAPKAAAAAKVETAKAEAKKEAVKKTAAAKKEEAPKAAAAKKAPAKKAAAKAETTSQVVIQYLGSESTVDSIVEKVTGAYVAEGHRASSIKDLRVYLKPEEGLAYYVINEKVAGKVDLF